MKITKDKIQKWIGIYKDSIKNFESRGVRGAYDDFESLARCELLLGNIKKAREYFEESDKSWLWYLDHNRDYITREWKSDAYLTYYNDRGLIIFFAYGKEKAREFINNHIGEIEEHWKEKLEQLKGYGYKLDGKIASGEIAYKIEALLHSYLIIDDKDSLLKIFDDISQRFEKYGRRIYKVGQKYPTLLIAMLKTEIVKAIIDGNKEEFLMILKERSDIKEKTLVGDHQATDYADLEMIFYSEMARQIWPDLVVDSPHIPEKLRGSSYFEELEKLGGDEK